MILYVGLPNLYLHLLFISQSFVRHDWWHLITWPPVSRLRGKLPVSSASASPLSRCSLRTNCIVYIVLRGHHHHHQTYFAINWVNSNRPNMVQVWHSINSQPRNHHYPTLNLRQASFSSRRCTDLEQSSAAYHICSVTSCLLLSLEDTLLRTLLPVITVVVPAKWHCHLWTR